MRVAPLLLAAALLATLNGACARAGFEAAIDSRAGDEGGAADGAMTDGAADGAAIDGTPEDTGIDPTVDAGDGGASLDGGIDVAPIIVSPVGSSVETLQLVAIGQQFGLVWSDTSTGTSQVFFTMIDENGQPDATPRDLSAVGEYPTLAARTDDFGIAWGEQLGGDKAVIHFSRIGVDGQFKDGITPLTSASGDAWRPSAAWDGNNFAVAYLDTNGVNTSVQLVWVAPNGSPVATDLVRSALQFPQRPDLLWTGNEYVVSWQGSLPDLGYARYDATGALLGSSVQVPTVGTLGHSPPALAVSPTSYLVAWFGAASAPRPLMSVAYDSSGRAFGDPLSLNSGNLLGLDSLWTGREFVVAHGSSGEFRLAFFLLDASGSLVGSFGLGDEARGSQTSLAWNGSRLGIAWLNNGGLRFALIDLALVRGQ